MHVTYIYTIYVWACFLYFARLLLKKIHLESFDHLNLLKHCNGCSFANPFMVRRKAISQSQKFKRPIGTTVLTPQNTELFMNSDTLAFHHHYGENQLGGGGQMLPLCLLRRTRSAAAGSLIKQMGFGPISHFAELLLWKETSRGERVGCKCNGVQTPSL